jgi:NADPH2:quinone reductase
MSPPRIRAVVCEALGGPETLVPKEVPRPEPSLGEVLISVAAAGVNFADSLIVAGKYQEKPAPPFTPGFEVAGRVAEVGSGVTHPRPGDRVTAMVGHGGFAEAALARADTTFVLPDEMDFDTAAGFPITYATAHAALVWRAGLAAGEVLLVHGAAGGVGLAAVEVGKALGAEVIATAGGPEKLAVAREHGADHTIDYKTEDIRERVKALTAGRGADVVFDPVGGEVFEASLRAVAWGARLLVIGFAAGRIPQVPANILLVKNIAVLGLNIGSYRRHAPERFAEQFERLFAWYREGLLKPHVSHRLPLEEAPAAIALLTGRRATGKVVLTLGDPEAGQ